MTAIEGTSTTKRLRVDFLFLDLTTCTRCRDTDESLAAALELAGEALASTGTDIEVNRIHVVSAEQARELRFLSSPTIRVDGRDVALELRESPCGSGACTDGCDESIACRLWVHDGREYTKPPVPMILDALEREVYAGEGVNRGTGAEPYELPENLERFFARRLVAEVGHATAEMSGAVTAVECCQPVERSSCCRPEQKAECCGVSSAEACGCR